MSGKPYSTRSFRASRVVLGILLGGCAAPSLLASTQDLLVLDDQNQLFRIDVDDPLTLSTAVTITGLAQGERIVSIAIDPATGNLLGYSTTQHCYIVDKSSGAATDLGLLNQSVTSSDTTRFIDFQPVNGHLRVQGSEHTNVEIDPSTLAVQSVGYAPNYVNGDVHDNVQPELAGSAFINNYPGSTSTQAYALDSGTDTLDFHTETSGLLFTIGDLGVDASLDSSLAADLTGRIVASIRAEGDTVSRIYSVDPESGAVTEIGALGSGMVASDIAFDLDPTSDDLDNDGWPNDIELAGASNFADPSSVPFPGATKVPNLTLAPALAQKLRVRVEFAANDSDRIVVKGRLPVGESTFDPNGKMVIVDVGGVTTFFVLDKKGHGVSAEGFVLDVDHKVGLGGVKYTLRMEHGNFQSHLSDEGIVDANTTAAPLSIDVDIWLSNLHARSTFHASYSATSGDHGIAK